MVQDIPRFYFFILLAPLKNTHEFGELAAKFEIFKENIFALLLPELLLKRIESVSRNAVGGKRFTEEN